MTACLLIRKRLYGGSNRIRNTECLGSWNPKCSAREPSCDTANGDGAHGASSYKIRDVSWLRGKVDAASRKCHGNIAKRIIAGAVTYNGRNTGKDIGRSVATS